MGSIYKRVWTDKASGKKVKGDTFWISYHRDGKLFREDVKTTSLAEAKLLLDRKEGNIPEEIPVTPHVGLRRFSQLAADIVKGLQRMWKKSEPDMLPFQSPPVQQARQISAPQIGKYAVIGPEISIQGNLTGEKSLWIEGSLYGMIEVRGHSVAIGKKGQVKADIHGKIIVIEGNVEGNLYADERLILRESGIVRGNIVSPRVALEDGSNFNGSINTM